MIRPNHLTILRVIFAIIFCALLPMANSAWLYGLCFFIFVAAVVTDFVDGELARKLKLETDFGKLADPIADKALVLGAFFMMAYLKVYSVWWIVLIASREVLVTVVRLIGVQQGRVLAAKWAGKFKTVIQYIAVIAAFVVLGLRNCCAAHWSYSVCSSILIILLIAANIVSVYSGVLFFRSLEHRPS